MLHVPFELCHSWAALNERRSTSITPGSSIRYAHRRCWTMNSIARLSKWMTCGLRNIAHYNLVATELNKFKPKEFFCIRWYYICILAPLMKVLAGSFWTGHTNFADCCFVICVKEECASAKVWCWHWFYDSMDTLPVELNKSKDCCLKVNCNKFYRDFLAL